MYKYNSGLIVGRFQFFHNGHKSILDKALKECEIVIVCIGSVEEKRNYRNPFNYEERKKFILSAYSRKDRKRIKFIPLVSIGVGDDPVWGNYILNSCKFYHNISPEVYYTGTESDRNNWFPSQNIKNVYIDRNIINISATELREALFIKKDLSIIFQYMNYKVAKGIIKKCKNYLNI